jgi:hypothetical protein
VQLKSEGDNSKKVLLIIDDIDRIDPEHIFRILNVFAAHFDSPDYQTSENKFGLDKIIISCDINNIKNIFHHKYGTFVDFNGYIDKFCSKEVFYFDIRLHVSNSVSDFLSTINLEGVLEYNWFADAEFQIKTVLVCMIFSNMLNLRALKKSNSKIYKFSIYSLQFPSGRLISSSVNLFTTFDYVSFLIGGVENAKQSYKLSNFVFLKTDIQDWNRIIAELIFVAKHDEHKFKEGDHDTEIDGHAIQYTIKGSPKDKWDIKIKTVDKLLLGEFDGNVRVVMNTNQLVYDAFLEFTTYRKNVL